MCKHVKKTVASVHFGEGMAEALSDNTVLVTALKKEWQ